MAPLAADRLDGWKAIADYLARDIRTLQRWRDERGLPIHRVPGSKGGTVFAYPAELDAWLRESPTVKKEESAAVVAESGESLTLAPFDSRALAPFDSRALAQGKQGRQDTRDPIALRRLVLIGLAGAAALAMGGIAGGLSWPTRPFERAELRSDSLVALDRDGRAVWSFRLPERSAEGSVKGALLIPKLREAAPVDLDGDGAQELVALVDFYQHTEPRHNERGEIFCLSSRGALLWTFTPEQTLTFGGRTFSGPWRNRAWLFASSTTPVWISFIHQTWWPSFVMTLDAKGRSELRFVSAGHIEALGRIATPSGTYMLAGGTNNDYGAAALAALDDQGAHATTSPSSGTPSMTCDGCPPGLPAKYLLFPRSELNIALGDPRNFVHLLTVSQGGGIDISVREHGGTPLLRGVYHLSADLTPEWFAMSDAYWETHRRLSGEGKLNHSPEECPERTRGMVVRSWERKAGWKELLVPHAFPAARQ